MPVLIPVISTTLPTPNKMGKLAREHLLRPRLKQIPDNRYHRRRNERFLVPEYFTCL
jgi:hypothetical protein